MTGPMGLESRRPKAVTAIPPSYRTCSQFHQLSLEYLISGISVCKVHLLDYYIKTLKEVLSFLS